MSNTEEEIKIDDKIREAERGHIAFLCTCFLAAIIPCLFPDLIDSLFARVNLTKYSDVLIGVILIIVIVMAIIHCKNHKKLRERLRKEKREFDAKAESNANP